MKNNKNSLTMKKSNMKTHPFWSVFWLIFLFISLWYAWYSFYVPKSDMVWNNNIVSSTKLAKNSNKNILVFFTGKWCSPCRIMKREVFADNEVMKAIEEKVIPVEINIDEPNNEKLVKKYNIGATPTTLFIDAQGNVIDYGVGKLDKSKILEILQKI